MAVTVLPLTRTRSELPTRVEIEADRRNGWDATSSARSEDVRSVSERRLVHAIGAVDAEVMASVTLILRRFVEP